MNTETIMMILGGLVLFGTLVAFMSYFQIWLRCLLSGALVNSPVLIAMKLRNTPVDRIVDAYIVCITVGMPIKIEELEKEYIAAPEDFELYVKELVKIHREENRSESGSEEH
jgi:uncharacterized protein YqfA (UPF0365 family)